MNILDYAIVRKIAGGSGGGGDDDWYIDNAYYLFYEGVRLNNLELFVSKMKDITNMSYMFASCTNLTSLDLSSVDTSKVTDMSYMFAQCTNLTYFNMSNFDTGGVTDIRFMFMGCSRLAEIIGFSVTNKEGITVNFPNGTSSSSGALKRLTFRTDLADGVYSIRSTINIIYCSFERDGMVEMFNTLPDVSSLTYSANYKKIGITGNPCVTDGTLTAEDEAIATSKGWTLVK